MTSTTQQAPESQFKQKVLELPKWLVALIALLLLSGAGFFGYRYWNAGHPSVGQEVDIGSGGFGRGGRGFNFNPRRIQMQAAAQVDPATLPDGIHEGAMNLSWVRSGDFYTSLPNGDAGNATVRVFYAKTDLLTADELSMLNARRRLPTDTALAKELIITPEQSKALVAIPLGIGAGLRISNDDREKLRAAWQVYFGAQDAAKDGAKTALLTTLKDIGSRSLEPTRQVQRDRVEQVKKILTTDQVAAWKAKGL